MRTLEGEFEKVWSKFHENPKHTGAFLNRQDMLFFFMGGVEAIRPKVDELLGLLIRYSESSGVSIRDVPPS